METRAHRRPLDAPQLRALPTIGDRQRIRGEGRRLNDTLAATESERLRWARELHDETLQGMAALRLLLGCALKAPPEDATAVIRDAVAQLENDIAALRAIIADLRPAALDELGLEVAVRTLVARAVARTGAEAHVTFDLTDTHLDADLETVAYRVAQEALTNVIRHSGAQHLTVDLAVRSGELQVTVTDDGCGIADAPTGLGLTGMRERAALASGTLEIAQPPDGGTALTLSLPLNGVRRPAGWLT
jgi:signal transduction histidine kinase